MDRRGRTGSRLLVTTAFQHPQHLQNPDAAGTGQRSGENAQAVIRPTERRPLHRLIVLQIGKRDQPAMRRHFRRQTLRRLAFVKLPGARRCDALERRRQLRLHQHIPGLVIRPALLKDALGFRIVRKVARAAQQFG